MEDTKFYHCEKCGKRLIVRKPNGLWHFSFGRFSKATTYLTYDITEYQKDLMIANPSYFSLPPFVIKLDSEEIFVGKVEGNLFSDLVRGFNKTQTDFHKSGIKVREIMQDEDGQIMAPVDIEIHGSLKITCLRKNCRHVNIFNYFPFTPNESVSNNKHLAD